MLTLLQQHDQLLAQPTHHLGVRSGNVDLVATCHHRALGKRPLDETQVPVTWAD